MSTVLDRLGGHGLAAYAEILWKTCRTDIQGWDLAAGILETGSPFIITAWHGQTHLLYPAFKDHLDLRRLAMIVVDDPRQAVLSTFAQVVGAQTFPVIRSDTTMAGARNMVALLQALKAGNFAYIAPDGPDGPPRVAKEGVAFLAARLNAWLIPIGSYCRTCYRIRRWDRYSLPLPWSRIRVVVGKPFQASQDMDRSHLLKELSQRMDAALMAAERG
jgi:lysophospholipid acyltransferase (LPLAT)-like uncharacterized protein